MEVIAVVGSKKSGKTTTIENLVRELTKRGHDIAVIKHISKPDFTIDTVGKDTWKFAKAGAKTVISVAATEIAKIEKIQFDKIPLEKLLERCEKCELVIIEGLKKLVGTRNSIPKIVVVKSNQEVKNAIELFRPILAFSGSYATNNSNLKIPYANGLTNPQKLADIVESSLKK
ncbi:molybdopterin-guanine dinucleotide biosynthesis protein B [Candidatus Bathyarchaeota archaeon]|nr:molybdopterin-guanine dinucleotide biosynthesis protein B [Candidatus Bathyarchaeota archaeon]MCJ7714435.1 molybdopterin-guanine dinucleotide biosynthesis protein B [Candidatus Bathyarchaeota archaeon]